MDDTYAVRLNDGYSIPLVGLGLWRVKAPAEFDVMFDAAIAAGYRHFDSAQYYQNEGLLGAAWQRTGLGREQFFITTKIAVTNFGAKRTARSFAQSLKNLQSDYVDLLLLHFPVSVLRKSSWRELEAIRRAGGARSIGVSNYTIKHLEEMAKYAHVIPAVNQVETHVFLQQPELRSYCHERGIVVEAYSPLAHGQAMSDPVVTAIAKKHGKSYAQVMLRWCLQKGAVVLPKSVTPERIRQNIQVHDFALDDDDMDRLGKLDKGLRTCWDPTHVP